MRKRTMYVPLLLVGLTMGVGACGGEEEGAMTDMEQNATETEWGPDSTARGMGMGAGSVADTMPSSPPGVQPADSAY